MDLIGGSGVGVVVGWLLPVVRHQTLRDSLASVLIAAIVVLFLAIQIGPPVAAAALVAMIGSATIHAVWRQLLWKRRETA